MKKTCMAAVMLVTAAAHADLADSLSDLQGYTVIGVMTVTGWIDRTIIFDDSKVLTCASYSYSYSYRPRAAILSNGSSFKMIIGDHVYDMRR